MIEAILGFTNIVVNVSFAIKTVKSVVEIGKKIWDKFKTNQKAQSSSQEAHQEAQRVQVEIVDLDREIEELERKFKRDAYKSKKDQERYEEIKFYKDQKFTEFHNIKSQEAALKAIENPSLYLPSQLDDENAHIIQYHADVSVPDKKCPVCGRPMTIRSKTQQPNQVYQLSDFFWSCTGWFYDPKQCTKTESLNAKDISLLHRNDIPELQATNSQLNTIFNEPSIQKATISRMREIKYSSDNQDHEVLCPIHHIPMELREKREPSYALDMFYLRCPHHQCNQVTKLKSVAQLASFLARKQTRGIL